MTVRRICALGALTTMTLLAAATVCGLWWLTSDLHEAARQRGTTIDEAVGLTAAVGSWLCVGWFVLAAACSVAAAVPGAIGRRCSAAAEVLAPWTLRKIVTVGLGLTVVTGPAAAAAPATPTLDNAPTSVMAHASSRTEERVGTDLPPLDRPAELAQVVTVGPGECLWSIAARHLGPAATDAEIAGAWPDWYAANRTVIGADPNLLQPGQRLVVPG